MHHIALYPTQHALFRMLLWGLHPCICLTRVGPELDCSASLGTLCKALGCCRRYEKAQKPLTAFDADISKYGDLSDEVLAENAAESIKFLYVDCGSLKQVGHLCCLMVLPRALHLTKLSYAVISFETNHQHVGLIPLAPCPVASCFCKLLHCPVWSVVAAASFGRPVMLLCGSPLCQAKTVQCPVQ